jgi:hypothetical protein
MTSPPQLSGWVIRIHEYLSETGISTARAVSWMQNNLYRLNLALSTTFYTDGTGYINPDMDSNQSGIYEHMYVCDYYSKKANENAGAGAFDWTEMEGDKQGRIRRVSRNEVSKTYQMQNKDCSAALKDLIRLYKQGNLLLLGQILYNDRGQIADGGLMDLHSPATNYGSNPADNRGDY